MARLSRRSFLGAGVAAALLPARLLAAAAPQAFQVQTRYYHEIDYATFKAGLLRLLDGGWQPLSIEAIVGALNGAVTIPGGLKAFHVTWDDSRLSQYTDGWRAISEIQQERGLFIPVTAFMLTMFDHLPLAMNQVPPATPCYTEQGGRASHHFFTKAQAVELIANGIHAGSHTVDHADLPRLSPDALQGQLITAEQRIQALWDEAGVKRPVKVFAYPYGDFNPSVVSAVQGLGYDAAFSTRPVALYQAADRFVLGRFGSAESKSGVY